MGDENQTMTAGRGTDVATDAGVPNENENGGELTVRLGFQNCTVAL